MLALLLISVLYLQDADAQGNAHANVTSIQVAANTTAIVIKPATGDVIGIDAFTIDTTTAWVKTYAANGVTCGTGTPKARYFIPGNTNGGGFISLPVTPDLYPGGITVCITGGYADSDTTTPTASKMVVNVHWQ